MENQLLPLAIATSFAAWSLVAAWYAVPWLRRQSPVDALSPLLLLHCFRFVGLAFLVEGVTSAPLDPRFAVPAAWGDFAAALLAFSALLALRRNWRNAAHVVWIFNLFGALDLLNAVVRGLRYTEDGHLGATWFIPAMIVPMLLISHGLIAWLQIRYARTLAGDYGGDRDRLPTDV